MDGDKLVQVLAALSNPHRLRIIAELGRERRHVSGLARLLGISRALLQVHLRKLEAAGLVTGHLELSSDGKAMNFYEVTDFAFALTPTTIQSAVKTVTLPENAPDTSKGNKP